MQLLRILFLMRLNLSGHFSWTDIQRYAGKHYLRTILYKKPVCLKRVILANGLVTVFVNLLLNTYWMSILYGNAYMVLFPTRAVKQLIMFPIEVILFYSVAKMFERANVFAIVRTKNI